MISALRSMAIVSGTLLFGLACASPGREAAWEKEAPVAGPGAQTSSSAVAGLMAEADQAWAGRDDRAKLSRAIELWESAAERDPTNAEVMIKLSRGYYFLVDGFIALEDGDINEQKLTNHQKGVDWGEKALLVIDPGFGAKMKAGADFEDAIVGIQAPAIPAAYWYCTNLGRFAVAKGLSAKLFYKDRVAAAMRRILELDPKFFHAGADRYFGAFYSALPSIAGKDVPKSGEHFDKAIAAAPHYLANKLLKADYYAVELDDKALYKKLLDEVIAGPEGDDPDCAPENRAAKRHAKKMLAKIDDRF
ncbi:MAG: hypothetical protein IT384_18515 [Deltaproteobacteria bacterium]|nr:hypothetical protein [Deltaproteobacteria bacterium]